jgi:hypothetical protein
LGDDLVDGGGDAGSGVSFKTIISADYKLVTN